MTEMNVSSASGDGYPDFRRPGVGAPTQRLVVLAAVIALHLLGLFAVWQIKPARQAMTDVARLMVNIIRPAPPPPPPVVIQPPKPLPVAPKPKPIERKPLPKPESPIIAARTPAPSAIEAPAPLPEPPAPIKVEEPPTPPPAPIIAPPVPPAPIVLPNFNADYLNNPPPEYPATSRRMGEEGRVVLRVFVEANGLPSRVDIKSSSGFTRLDQTAREVVTQWRFVPARQGGEKVAAWVLVPIQFTLN
jgi:periplasmic protein TonB